MAYKMGYEILESESKAVFICNTSDTAFGPVMYGGREQAEAFVIWLDEDPRRYDNAMLMILLEKFMDEIEEGVSE